jgi:hypothetical protein
MINFEKIIKSSQKPKEIISLLAEKLTSDNGALSELISYFEKAPVTEKGHCIEAIEYATQEDPEIVSQQLDFVINNLSHKAPRVKWEAARIIGNIAKHYPDEVTKAVPGLLGNTNDKGTVVRWSAAFALTEIAKNNITLQAELILKFLDIIEYENNNGVKNLYFKALKSIEKKK